MKFFTMLMLVFALLPAFASSKEADVLNFVVKIGFERSQGRILEYKFLEGGKKILLVGSKNLQIWDYENGELISSVRHGISDLESKGYVDDAILSHLPDYLKWQPFVVDSRGRWFAMTETIGAEQKKAVVVRDAANGRRLAVLELPDNSIDYVYFDEKNNEILAFGMDGKTSAFAAWDANDFTRRRLVPVADYQWHRFIKNNEKILVISGEPKFLTFNEKPSNPLSLTLRNGKTGATEKEYFTPGITENLQFLETFITRDEKLIVAKRKDFIYVWDVDGSGQPRMQIPNDETKGTFDKSKFIGDRYIALSRNEKLLVYDVRGDAAPKFELSTKTPGDSFDVRAIAADSDLLVVSQDDRIAVLKASGDGKPLYEIVRTSPNERFQFAKIAGNSAQLIIGRSNKSDDNQYKNEIYDLRSGKLLYTAPRNLGNDVDLTADGRFLYSTLLGNFVIWDLERETSYKISLETNSTNNTNPDALDYDRYSTGSPFNVEYIAFNPDDRYFLRYGQNLVTVYETETGKEVQRIFNPEKVKYSQKTNKVKESGLYTADWSEDGKYIFAFDYKPMRGASRTISFWQMKK